MNRRRRSNQKRVRSETSATSARQKIAVLGVGNMATAMAHALAGNGHEVTVWDFFPAVVEDIRTRRENPRFLPGVRWHAGVRAVNSPVECVTGAAFGGILKNVDDILVGSLAKLRGDSHTLEASLLTASVRERAAIDGLFRAWRAAGQPAGQTTPG